MNSKNKMCQNLGEFFRAARENAGFTLEEAVQHLQIESAALLLQIEKGETAATLSQMHAFANIYNIAPEDLHQTLFALTALDPELRGQEIERLLKTAN